MQEAVTLKPNSKLTKKKVWGPRKLNFKAFGAITVLPKKSQIFLYTNIRTYDFTTKFTFERLFGRRKYLKA
jgi:hypothetical protein